MDDTVDKVALRREARRRKILENAKGRLEQLNGRTVANSGSGDITRECETRDYSDPEVEPDILPPRSTEEPPHLNFPTDYSEVFNTWTTANQPTKEKQHFLLVGRVHILLAAVLSYSVTMWRWHSADNAIEHSNDSGDGGGVDSFSIFLPVGLIVALELIFFRGQQQMSPLLNLMITLSGIRAQIANRYLQFFTTIQSLIVDMGIFIFFFCSLTFLFSCVNESFMSSITIK